MQHSDDIHSHIREHCQEIVAVGSRVTCSPPPLDTDIDYLVLTQPGAFWKVVWALDAGGYELGGSEVYDASDCHLGVVSEGGFQSFKKGDVNYIITCDEGFFKQFVFASDIAKKLNLLDKKDRVALFQIILYDNFGD